MTTLTREAALPIDVQGAGYTEKELTILAHCWDKSGKVSRCKTDLAFELYALKQEMDRNDPNVTNGGGGRGRTRFWAAFEAGHLPYQGNSGRRSVETAITAAEWIEGQEPRNPLRGSLRALAPSTIVEIGRLTPENQQIVFDSISTSQFIGVTAVRLLARVADKDTQDRLTGWVRANGSRAITPKTIRALQAEVEAERQPAAQQTVDAKAQPAEEEEAPAAKPWGETTYDGPPQRTPEEREEIRKAAAERGRQAEVKRTLEASEKAAEEKLKADHKRYAESLCAVLESLQALKTTLGVICAQKGTVYLDELRQLPGGLFGWNYVANDVAELKRAYDLLRQIAEVATSREGPQTIDWQTIEVEAR